MTTCILYRNIFKISRHIRITSTTVHSLKFRQFSSKSSAVQNKKLESIMKLDSNRRNSQYLIKPNKDEEYCEENEDDNLYSDDFPLERNRSENVEQEPDILLDPSLTDEDREKLKQYKREYEIWKYADANMPDYLSNDDWKLILKMNTVRERVSYMTYKHRSDIFKIKYKIERKVLKKKTVLEKLLQKKAERGDHIIYGIGHNTMVRRYNLHTVNRYLDLRAINAICTGPIIVFDCSFFDEQTVPEISATFNQLYKAVELNQRHRQPAALIFTSFFEKNEETSSPSISFVMKKYVKSFHDFPSVYTTEKSYMDLFPVKQLLYLCPGAPVPLMNFDSERVHIIGALSDRSRRNYLTIGKAKEYGIEARKLPLSNYIKLESGVRYTRLDRVLGMLLDCHVTNDWYKSIVNNTTTTCDDEKRKIANATRRQNVPYKEKIVHEYQRVKFLASLTENV